MSIIQAQVGQACSERLGGNKWKPNVKIQESIVRGCTQQLPNYSMIREMRINNRSAQT